MSCTNCMERCPVVGSGKRFLSGIAVKESLFKSHYLCKQRCTVLNRLTSLQQHLNNLSGRGIPKPQLSTAKCLCFVKLTSQQIFIGADHQHRRRWVIHGPESSPHRWCA